MAHQLQWTGQVRAGAIIMSYLIHLICQLWIAQPQVALQVATARICIKAALMPPTTLGNPAIDGIPIII